MKNPKEFLHFGRPNKVVALEDHLSAPIDPEKNMPMEVTSLSRFIFTILDKSGKNPLNPFANLPESDFALLKQKAEFALSQKLQKELIPAAPAPTSTTGSAPYTAKFTFGANMKGKTIPEVLGENPEKELPQILRTRDLLKENVKKFPANQKMIDEIDRAENEIKSGKYNKAAATAATATATSGDTIVVYRQQSKPLVSKKMDVEGESQTRYLVYNIEIVCELQKSAPWKLTIMNCYCPLEMNPVSKQNLPVLSKAINQSQSSFQMTDQEFFRMIAEMETHILTFHTYNDPKQRAAAVSIEKKLREAAASATTA